MGFFSLLNRVQTGSGAHPVSPIQCITGSLYPWVKRPRREADYSTPSSAEFKNGGARHPLPQYVFMPSCLAKQWICLYGVLLVIMFVCLSSCNYFWAKWLVFTKIRINVTSLQTIPTNPEIVRIDWKIWNFVRCNFLNVKKNYGLAKCVCVCVCVYIYIYIFFFFFCFLFDWNNPPTTVARRLKTCMERDQTSS
jgi:hypothetical protein